MMPDPITPFEKLLAGLAVAKVDFVVVGGVAVCLNGHVRTTVDVDILVEDSRENLQRMLAELADFGEGHARELSVDDFKPAEGCVQVGEDFPLDIFTRMGGRSYGDFKPHIRFIASGDVKIPYLSAEGLILLKQDSWRVQDRFDVAALKEIMRREKGSH